MTEEKIFLVKQKLSRRDEDTEMWIYDFDNQVELTKEELEHLTSIIDVEIADFKLENMAPCGLCFSILKKLEGLNG